MVTHKHKILINNDIGSIVPDPRNGSPGPAEYDQSKYHVVKEKNPEWR
jgi:hypothetical protein